MVRDCEFLLQRERRNDIISKLGLSEAFVIGHAGHLAKVKNQQFLIELMPKILIAKPNVFLLLLGEGDDRPLLEQRISELGLNGHIRLTGNVRNVGDYLSAMDVFAFPSLYEGMPLTLIEAQSNGLPCVISDRVPHDVFITDLVNVLPLDNADEWLNTIVAAERHEPQKYADIVSPPGSTFHRRWIKYISYTENVTEMIKILFFIETLNGGGARKGAPKTLSTLWIKANSILRCRPFIPTKRQKTLPTELNTNIVIPPHRGLINSLCGSRPRSG